MSSPHPLKIKAEIAKSETRNNRFNEERIKTFRSNPSPLATLKSRDRGGSWAENLSPGGGLNCAFYEAAFGHADLRVPLPEVRPKFRDVPIDARQAFGHLSKRTLPSSQVGSWQSETSPRHRRGINLQRLGVLHHRLPKQGLPGSCEKGISGPGWRKSCYSQGTEDGKSTESCSFG